MPKWLSPIFPTETVEWRRDFDVSEALRRLQAATEPPQFSSVVRPAVVGLCTDSSVQLWVQDQALGVGRMNCLRPRFVGALRQWDGNTVLAGQFDLTPFGTLAMGLVSIAGVGVLVGLILGDVPRVPIALVGVGLAFIVTSSRRQYLEDVVFVSQVLEAALRRAPNLPLQPTSDWQRRAEAQQR